MTLPNSIHLAATWMLVGLIWVVQVLVYPQFLRLGATEFKDYHFAHSLRILLLVSPMLLVEVGSGAWLLYEGRRTLPFLLSLGLILVVWLSTALFQAPIHLRLMRGYDAPLIRRLILTNWIRTLAWTTRGVLVSLALS